MGPVLVKTSENHELPTEKRRLFSNDDSFAPSVNYGKTFIGVTKGMLNHRDLEYHVLIPSQH